MARVVSSATKSGRISESAGFVHRVEPLAPPIGVKNRIMWMRFVGTLIAIAAATLVYVAVDGLSRGDEMARTLAMFADSNADRFDANDWRWRWRFSSGLLLILGMVVSSPESGW